MEWVRSLRAPIAVILFLQSFAGAGSAAASAPAAIGPQFQVNSYSTDAQYEPAVAVTPSGDFVVVWRSWASPGSDTLFTSILGRRFDTDGTPLEDDFQVNTFAPFSQHDPAVASLPTGEFVVAWTSGGSAGSDNGPYSYSSIQARRFGADGTPAGDDFQVNWITAQAQQETTVAVGPEGELTVAWRSDHSHFACCIQARQFEADGTPIGGEFPVNTYTTSSRFDPAIAAGPDGDFIIVWTSDGSLGNAHSEWSIQGQRFAADATPLGSEFQVNAHTLDRQNDPAVAIGPEGEFVVAWTSRTSVGPDSSNVSVQARRFSPAGEPMGEQWQVNTYTTERQLESTVAVSPSGDFLIAWTSDGSSGSDTSLWSVQAQAYDPAGQPRGPEFQINSCTTGLQDEPSVAAGRWGEFVATWASVGSFGPDSSSISIQGQRYALTIFSDGFESGDTSAW